MTPTPSTIRDPLDRAAARSERRTYAPWAARPALAASVAGYPVLAVDFAGVTNAFACDALGRRLSATDGRGNATHYAYDPAGNLLSATDAAGFATTYAYDLLGRRIAATAPLGNVTHTAYDGADRVVAEWGATYPAVHSFDAYGREIALATTRDSAFELTHETVPYNGKCYHSRDVNYLLWGKMFSLIHREAIAHPDFLDDPIKEELHRSAINRL